MEPVRTPSSLEATGASKNDVQVMIPVSDEELVAPTMSGFGTPEVPLDGSRFEAYRFPAPTCPEYAEAVAPRLVPSASNMTTAELANAMEVLSLLNQSGRLQQMAQQIEHHEGSFTNAPQTHESGTTSSSTNPFQSVPWRSNVTYATIPRPPIRGEHIVHGVPTGVPEPKFFSEPQAPKRTHVFEASPSSEESTILLSTLQQLKGPSSEESTILLSTLQQLKGRLENLENRTSANLTTNPCVPYHPSPLTRVCTGLAGVPPGVKLPFVPRTKAPKPVACFTTTYEVYTLDQALALGLGPLAPMALLPDPTQPVPHTGRGTKAFFKPQTETKLPKFSGRDLDVYAEDFLRFLRSTGQEDLNERAKADLVINGCDNKDVKEVVSGALKKSDSWVRFLITLENLYSTYVTYLELNQDIECIPRLKEYPTTADIAQYVQKFTTLTDQLATSYYDDSKALLHLLLRVPPKTMDEIRATPERLSRIHTFNSLVDLLYELALQRKSDATLKNLHSMAQLNWLDGNTNADSNAPMNQEEAFAHSLCEECFVSFQQARGQANGNRGGGGRGRGKGGRGKGQGQGQWYWRREVEEDNSTAPKFFATVFCPNCGTKHNVRDKAWQDSLEARKEEQKQTKKGQGKGGKDQAKGGEKGSGGKANGGKANEVKGGKGKDEDKGKPQEKKRLEELTEREREKKRKRVLKLERQAKNLKDFLAGQTPGEA